RRRGLFPVCRRRLRMNMPVLKTEPSVTLPAAAPGVGQAAAAASAHVVALNRPQPPFVTTRLVPMLGAAAARVLPPLIMLALILTVWQILCMKPGATLPWPTKIWSEAYDLI